MKNTTQLLVIPILFPMLAIAQTNTPLGNINGEISLVVGGVSSNSNLATIGDDNVKNGALNSGGSRHTDVIGGPLGNINYTFGRNLNQRLFLGTSRDDIAVGVLAFEAGYQYTFPSKMSLSVSYLPTILAEKAWADPYLTNAPREETDRKGHAFRVRAKNILGSPVSFEQAYADFDVKNEQSGQNLGLSMMEQNQLARSGKAYYSKLSYRQVLGRALGITPSLIYQDVNTQGDAMANNGYGAELTYFNFAGRNKLVVTASYLHRDFNANNPIFNEKRKDNELGIFAAYEFQRLLNHPSLSFTAFAGYQKVDSNIDFYRYQQYITAAGVIYRF